MQWNINRWYDPKVGRWISEDPIGFEAKDANLFRYTLNQPTIQRDYLGLWKSNVHNNMTRDWAVGSAGYKWDAAVAIGNANESTDNYPFGGTGPIPVVGDQSYHFNRTIGNGLDSRIVRLNERFAAAKKQ